MTWLAWVAVATVVYLGIGWLVAYRLATETVRERDSCKLCGRAPYHDRRCTCDTCRMRSHVCKEHETTGVGAAIPLWPLVFATTAAVAVWDSWKKRFSPATVVEKKYEEGRMHVIVPSDKKEMD